MKPTRRASLIAVALAALVLGTASRRAEAAPTETDAPAPAVPLRVGARPPELSVSRISGSGAIDLSGLAGQVVIIDFWATWCGPCRQLMPALDALHRTHGARGLSIVGLSPEPEARIRDYLAARPVGYTIARDVGGTVRAYGVRTIPSLVILDRTGKVRDIVNGVDGGTVDYFEQVVTHLLGETR